MLQKSAFLALIFIFVRKEGRAYRDTLELLASLVQIIPEYFLIFHMSKYFLTAKVAVLMRKGELSKPFVLAT